MEYDIDKKEIALNRELNNLDRFVIKFCKLLKEYVIVSGYVSILFGRTRATEDIDLLVPYMKKDEFEKLWKKIYKEGFECINTQDLKEAFEFLQDHAIRFFLKSEKPIPNIEFKMIKNELDEYSFQNKIKVIIKNDILFVSSIEMQIAFKLFLSADGTADELSSDKDIEDARHLYKIFKDKINKDEMMSLINKLKVEKKIRWLQ